MLVIFFLLGLLTQVTSTVLRVQVCEWARPDGRTLSCPAGQTLRIDKALYGRKSLSICGHAHHKGVTNCGSSSSLNKAKQLCNGKKTCHLRASNSMFGDPCWGVNKYLDVSYECMNARVNADALLPLVGTWTLEDFKSRKDTYTISSDGTVTLVSNGATSHIRESDNQVDFPSSEGWYIISRHTTWEYIRLKDDGEMEVHHFCTNGCSKKYKHSKNYCCKGRAFKIAAKNRPTRTYELSIKTGNKNYAGTAAKVFIRIYGEKGDTGTIYIKKSFYQNTVEKVTVKAMDVGKLTMMKIGHDNTGVGPGWYLANVIVKVGSCASTFSAWQWLTGSKLKVDVYPTLEQGECPTSENDEGMETYDIDVKTGNVVYAGTDEQVYFVIYGKKGDTGKLYFPKSKTHKYSFLRNQLDKFTIRAKNIGKVVKIKIGNENTGGGYGWHLAYVVVKVKSCTTKFSTYTWLHGSKRTVVMNPKSQDGNCEERSTGSMCRRDFRKIGCFSRDWSKVPVLVITDIDPTHRNYTTDMNWDDYAQGLHSLACRCRAKAVGQYKYFGIGFYGECVAGKDHKALEKMFTSRNEGNDEGCVNGKWEACTKSRDTECAGKEDFDFFYEIVE